MALGGEASNLRKELNKPHSGEKWEIIADALALGPILGGIPALIICLILHWVVINPKYSAAFTLKLCPCDAAIFATFMLTGIGTMLVGLYPDRMQCLKVYIITAVCMLAIGTAVIVQADFWNSEMEKYADMKEAVEETTNKSYYNDPAIQEEIDREVQEGIIYDDTYDDYYFDYGGAPY